MFAARRRAAVVADRYLRARAKLHFDQSDQFPQLDRARFAEINDFVVTLVVVNRRANAGDDVINVSVIAARGAVAKNRNRLCRR